MERPTPKKEMVNALFGEDVPLVKLACSGLMEVPLHRFYSHINFKDLLVFAIGSRYARENYLDSFIKSIENRSAYQIFDDVARIEIDGYSIFQLLGAREARLPKNLSKQYDKLNPYRTKDLETRLGRVDERFVRLLEGNLQKRPKEFVSEGRYINTPADRRDNLVCAGFLPMSLRGRSNREIVEAHVGQIVRLISGYPTEVKPVEPTLF